MTVGKYILVTDSYRRLRSLFFARFWYHRCLLFPYPASKAYHVSLPSSCGLLPAAPFPSSLSAGGAPGPAALHRSLLPSASPTPLRASLPPSLQFGQLFRLRAKHDEHPPPGRAGQGREPGAESWRRRLTTPAFHAALPLRDSRRPPPLGREGRSGGGGGRPSRVQSPAAEVEAVPVGLRGKAVCVCRGGGRPQPHGGSRGAAGPLPHRWAGRHGVRRRRRAAAVPHRQEVMGREGDFVGCCGVLRMVGEGLGGTETPPGARKQRGRPAAGF